MEIVFLGHSSFRLTSGGKSSKVSIVTDPFDPTAVGLKYTKVEADIVTISHDHADHNQASQIANVKKVINGPGEYEIGGVSIIGISSFHDNEKGAQRGKNTMYVIEMDGLRIAHLGDLGHDLEESVLTEIGEIDILMIPVGGEFTIDAEMAATVAKKIEPNIIIPMHYQMPGLADTFSKLEAADTFISKLGLAHETLPKLVLRESLQLDEEQKIIILEKK